jgi:hypothetical protein
MNKPDFPKPRLIQEGFLPRENYRIKKVNRSGDITYFPQEKVFFWWFNLRRCEGYYQFKNAQIRLLEHIREKEERKHFVTVEYIYNFEENE